MAVVAGPFPGSEGYAEWKGKKRDLFGMNKRAFKSAESFRGHGNPEKPSYRYIRNTLNGDTYKVPARDYNEINKYLEKASGKVNEGGLNQVRASGLTESYIVSKMKGKAKFGDVRSAGDFVDFGFSDDQKENIAYVECQGGHIKALTYNPKYLLLRVEFEKRGDICVFFNLPANVATTLMYLARNNTMAPPGPNGEERHAVGVEFWNLVRVRGTVHETRFQFMYEYGGPSGEGIPSASGGDFSRSEERMISEITQERNPNRNVLEPTPAKDSSSAVDGYGTRDLYRILDREGEYRPWFDELTRGFMASGDSYMMRLANDAERAYARGSTEDSKKALKELARNRVSFPDSVEGEEMSYGDTALSEE